MAARDADGDGSLRPFRWPRRPGGVTLLRAVLVAVLLGLAVIVLDAPDSCATGTSPAMVSPVVAGISDARGPAGAQGPAGSAALSGTAYSAVGCPASPTGAADGSATAGRPAPATPHRRTDADGVTAVPHGQDDGRSAQANRDRAADGGAPAALPLPSGFVGVPVRLAEPAALAVLRPGARVDLLVLPAGRNAGETVLLAADALVLDVVGGDATDGSSALYLAVRPDQAQRSVSQPEGSRFSVVIRG
ncbi:hypothetical protein [Micromonospora wenchangensis]|uniref:hypothetical protein n=1 Tax=Micromonospora wenchangensis TaxID=1185415 RepID=UPI00380DC7AA